MMSEIFGKWTQIEGQPFSGLQFVFLEDGTFKGIYNAMNITSAGTYEIDGQNINLNQKTHTFSMVGKFDGIFEIEDGLMKLALPEGPNGPRPSDFSFARQYTKED